MLWMLEDARWRTYRALEGVPAAVFDWQPPAKGNSIATLLYHIAAIELDWLAEEVMLGRLDPQIWNEFPYEVRDKSGHLTCVTGESLEAHYRRLDSVRELLLKVYKDMSVDAFRQLHIMPNYDVSPEEVLHHLAQHEAEHRGEIMTIRAMAQHALNTSN